MSEQAFRGLQPSDLGIRATEEAARAMGDAGAALGQEAGQVYQGFQDRQDATDLTTANAQTNTAIFNGHKAVSDYVQTADPSDPDYYDKISKHIDDAFAPVLDGSNSYSEKVRNHVQQDVDDQKRQLLIRVIGEHTQAQAQQAEAAHNEGITNLVRTAVSDPASLPDVLGRINESNVALIGHGYTKAQTDDFSRKDRDSAANETALSLLEKNAADPTTDESRVAALKANINDPNGPFQPNLTGEHLNDINEKLDKLKGTQDGIQFGLLKQNLPGLYTAIDRGAPPTDARATIAWLAGHAKTKEEILAVGDAQHDLAQHEQYGQVYAATRDLSNPDIQKVIDATHTAWQGATSPEDRDRLKGQEEALTQARDSRNKEFHADPASYAIANDGATNARYRAFSAQPNAQSWQAYSQAAGAYQRRLFPGEVPKLVTAEVRDSIRQGIQAITYDKTKGVQTAGQTLEHWSQITGSSWINMSRELHTSGILNDDQFIAATLYGKPTGRHLADEMLQASAMTGKDLYILHGVSSDKAAQAAIAELQPLAESLGNQGEDGAEIMRANTLALAHLLQLRGDPNQSADLAKTLVLDEFTFTGRNGSSTLRVPNRPDLDAGKINSGSQSVLSSLDSGGQTIIVPPSNSGLNPGDQRKVYIDRIQHTGVWYSNGPGTGAVLYDIDSGSPVQERGKDGQPQPVLRSWKQLMDMGAAAADTTSAHNIETYQRAIKR